MQKNKTKESFSFQAFFQRLFITSDFFLRNSLQQNAAACSFGFLFSVLPVTFMILIVFIRVLHGNQAILDQFFPYLKDFISFDQYNTILSEILSIKRIGILEVLTGITIFWMARKFFVSIMNVFKKIYKNQADRKAYFYDAIAYIFEIILIVGIAVIFAIFVAIMPFLRSNFFRQNFPILSGGFLKNLLTFAPTILLFIIVTLIFKFATGTKPSFRLCFSSAFFAVGIFVIIQKIFSLLINITRYNLVYGVLSNLIVLLIEVHVFFQVFLFFAQYIYVSQFFNILLFGEMYLLPQKNHSSLWAGLKRALFIKPSKHLNYMENTVDLQKGDVLYNQGENGVDVYYIVFGIAQVEKDNRIDFLSSGSFIGESECLFCSEREATVKAKTDLQLICIKQSDFMELLKSNPEISVKILDKITKV